MLRYRPGDWNALHRDLYGDLVFPLQVVIGLHAPGTDNELTDPADSIVQGVPRHGDRLHQRVFVAGQLMVGPGAAPV